MSRDTIAAQIQLERSLRPRGRPFEEPPNAAPLIPQILHRNLRSAISNCGGTVATDLE